LQLLLFFLHQTLQSIKDRHQSINQSPVNIKSHFRKTQTKPPHTFNSMFFFGASRVGKPASEATQTPRSSTSSQGATPTPVQQQARKQGKKLSVAEDYWTNPALWPVGTPRRS
jgi:hypothetical protein